MASMPRMRRTVRASCRLESGGGSRHFNLIEFHYVPKHASWLNMVEFEIGVMRTQCLDGVRMRCAVGALPADR